MPLCCTLAGCECELIYQAVVRSDIRSDATVVPSLLFHIDADSITVYNNELGFEEPNVRAVCDVGKTTKGKHKFGYIGMYVLNIVSIISDRYTALEL